VANRRASPGFVGTPLVIIGQLADVRVCCFVLPNARRFRSTRPVAVLVVFVDVARLQPRLRDFTRFVRKSTRCSGQLERLHVRCISKLCLRESIPCAFAFQSYCLRGRTHSSLGIAGQSGALRDLSKLHFHLLECSSAVFDRDLVTKGLRPRKVFGDYFLLAQSFVCVVVMRSKTTPSSSKILASNG
jgi:hypothetical protein